MAAAARIKPSRVRATRKRTVAKHPLARKKAVTRRRRLPIPPILFEGDRPSPPSLSGRDRNSSWATSAAKAGEAAELPEAYGTGRLFVTSRDPIGCMPIGNLTREQQRRCNARLLTDIWSFELTSAQSRLSLPRRSTCILNRATGLPTWTRGDRYVAELAITGANINGRAWPCPRQRSCHRHGFNRHRRYVLPRFRGHAFRGLLAEVNREVGENLPLAQAWEQLRQHRQSEAPATVADEFYSWTPERERALAEVIRADTSPCA